MESLLRSRTYELLFRRCEHCPPALVSSLALTTAGLGGRVDQCQLDTVLSRRDLLFDRLIATGVPVFIGQRGIVIFQRRGEDEDFVLTDNGSIVSAKCGQDE